MKQYKHILCPIDFSKSSPSTLNQAIDLAKNFNSNITVVHFIEPLPPAAYNIGVSDLEDEMYKDAKKKMEAVLTQHSELTEDNVKIEMGHAKTTIPLLSEELGIDLIVIGCHGHHGILSDFIGSTASSTANHAPCDIFIIREK